MTHNYQITGMTCISCEAKVKTALLTLPDIESVEVSKEKNEGIISMSKHIAISDLQQAIGGAGSKYQITATHHSEVAEQTKSWFSTYKPILLIFAYITIISTLVSFQNSEFNIHNFMNVFMAGFFITFSFFKMLDRAKPFYTLTII